MFGRPRWCGQRRVFLGKLALVIAACWHKLGPRGLVFQRRRPKWQVCVETRKQSHADTRHGGEHILKRGWGGAHTGPKNYNYTFAHIPILKWTHTLTHSQSLCWEGWVMHTVCVYVGVWVCGWVFIGLSLDYQARITSPILCQQMIADSFMFQCLYMFNLLHFVDVSVII